jgi:hypothetical protein
MSGHRRQREKRLFSAPRCRSGRLRQRLQTLALAAPIPHSLSGRWHNLRGWLGWWWWKLASFGGGGGGRGAKSCDTEGPDAWLAEPRRSLRRMGTTEGSSLLWEGDGRLTSTSHGSARGHGTTDL